MALYADFYDGKSALTHPAVCRFFGDMLEIRSRNGDVLARWDLGDIVADAPHKTPLRLRHTVNSGERLVVREASAIASFTEWLSPVLAKQRTGTRLRWIFGGAAVWLLLALGWIGFPHVVNAVVSAIPYSWEQSMGKESRNTIGRLLSGVSAGEIPWLNAGPGYDALNVIVTRLARADDNAGEGTDRQFDVSILDAGMINAFALPGNFIVVTTGLIRQCRTPDELAGVLAHEMAHVTERHNLRRLVRDQFFILSLNLVTGGSDLADIAGEAGKLFLSRDFSRKDEREADILGVRRLAVAGVHPESIAWFFAGFPESSSHGNTGVFSYLDSHPKHQERQQYMQEEAARFPGSFTPALEPNQWSALRKLAMKKARK